MIWTIAHCSRSLYRTSSRCTCITTLVLACHQRSSVPRFSLSKKNAWVTPAVALKLISNGRTSTAVSTSKRHHTTQAPCVDLPADQCPIPIVKSLETSCIRRLPGQYLVVKSPDLFEWLFRCRRTSKYRSSDNLTPDKVEPVAFECICQHLDVLLCMVFSYRNQCRR